MLCPLAHHPAVIDPLTGASELVHPPGLELEALLGLDADIDLSTRDLRYFGGSTGNSSHSFNRVENRLDATLSPPFQVAAVAHKPALNSEKGVETYVIGRLTPKGREVAGAPWYQLARIGRPDGDPPASSGPSLLCGIAVALSGLGGTVVESPALSHLGLGLFAFALCAAALLLSPAWRSESSRRDSEAAQKRAHSSNRGAAELAALSGEDVGLVLAGVDAMAQALRHQ